MNDEEFRKIYNLLVVVFFILMVNLAFSYANFLESH